MSIWRGPGLEQHQARNLAALDRLQLRVYELVMTGGVQVEHSDGKGIQRPPGLLLPDFIERR